MAKWGCHIYREHFIIGNETCNFCISCLFYSPIALNKKTSNIVSLLDIFNILIRRDIEIHNTRHLAIVIRDLLEEIPNV